MISSSKNISTKGKTNKTNKKQIKQTKTNKHNITTHELI